MAFELAEQDWNEEGWGPKGHNPFFSEVVYAPFSKGDKLGRVADWAGQINAGRERAYTTGIVNQNFGFLEDDTFQLVDNTKSKPSFTKTQQRQPFKGGNRPPPPQKNLQKLGSTKAKPAKARSFKPRQNWGTQTKTRDPSIEVKANWQVLEEIDFVRLAKTSFSPPSTVTDLKFCGSLFHYDRNYDRITTRTEKPLANVKKVYGRVSASNDPILKEFADSGEGNVFATDSIIALLMSSTRSVLPWDIVVTRVGEQLFFDKRNTSQIDLDTVNETAPENQNEGGETVNNEALSMEASEAAQSFVQQVLKKAEIHKFQDPSPFEDDSSPHKAYRYRKFVLDEGVSLVLRTEIDGFIKQSSTAFINLRSLIEYDPKQGPSKWRAKLDSQRGATFANELKNNSNKIARWTAEALLSGVDHIKLGFVSRINPKSSEKHSLLATQVLKPVEFANQINFNLSNAWGIVKSIVDYFLGLPEGKYLLAKDANKSMMRIYRVPEEDVADQEEEIRDDE